MKKLLLLTLLVIQFSKSEAQSWVYHPFPTDSAVWTNARGTWMIPPGWPTVPWPAPYVQYDPPELYCMPATDTVIGSIAYSELFRCGIGYAGALRDDGAGKVYFIPPDSTNELLIYDFTVGTGDTAHVYEQDFYSFDFHRVDLKAGLIDSVMVNGSYRKRVNFNGEPGVWVEGIGCSLGLFRNVWANVSYFYSNLDCMSQDDTTIYPSYSAGGCSLTAGISAPLQAEEIAMYPNPTGGLLQITTTQLISRVKVTDILGNILISKNNVGNISCELDLSGLAADLYFVRMEDAKGNYYVKKIVKQ
ncbi:MAG: hypothetical protein JWO09_1619 [Bacteroidetes bacterium]|nr:hypothetical protein [Bacteroidota bacterium]